MLISDGEVSLIVYETLAKNRARVFYSKYLRTQRRGNNETQKSEVVLSSAVYRLLHEFEQDMMRKERRTISIQYLTFFYAPPFSFSAAEEISAHCDEKKQLNEIILLDLLRNAENTFYGRLTNGGIDKKNAASRYTIIEKRISSAMIEGYLVNDYLGRLFCDFSARVSFTSVPTSLVLRLTDSCHSIFRKASIHHSSVAHASLAVLSSLYPSNSSFLFSVVLSNLSFLTYAQNNASICEVIFDGGEDHALANLSSALSVTKTVASSYINMFRNKKLHDKSEEYFVKALSVSLDAWLKDLVFAYQGISEMFMLPKSILVVPSGNVCGLALQQNYISSDKFMGYNLNVVDIGRFSNVESTENVLISPLDALLTEAAFAHTSVK